ncbi:MAG: hypothetical protein ACE5MG_08580 [Candidatus Methylomirabilales bacterium]
MNVRIASPPRERMKTGFDSSFLGLGPNIALTKLWDLEQRLTNEGGGERGARDREVHELPVDLYDPLQGFHHLSAVDLSSLQAPEKFAPLME